MSHDSSVSSMKGFTLSLVDGLLLSFVDDPIVISVSVLLCLLWHAGEYGGEERKER